MKKIIMSVILCLMFVGFVSTNVQAKNNEIIFNSVNGTKVRLSKYKGRKLYIKYWATWCPSCLSGLDDLGKLAKQKNDFKVLSMIAPSAESEMSEKEFKKWWKNYNYKKLNVLFDPEHKYADTINVRGVPTNVFIDKKGKIASIKYGSMSNDDIVAEMKNI